MGGEAEDHFVAATLQPAAELRAVFDHEDGGDRVVGHQRDDHQVRGGRKQRGQPDVVPRGQAGGQHDLARRHDPVQHAGADVGGQAGDRTDRTD